MIIYLSRPSVIDIFYYYSNTWIHVLIDQCLELCEEGTGETCGVRGQVIVSLVSRDAARGEPAAAAGEGSPLAVVGPAGDVRTPRDPRDPPPAQNGTRNPLPQHWEERFTSSGRLILLYVFEFLN